MSNNCFLVTCLLLFVFVLCSENGNQNPSDQGSKSEFIGKWKGMGIRTRMYDSKGTLLSDTLEPTIGYVNIGNDKIIVYIPTDSCITIDGPYKYTFKNDTISYVMVGFLTMNVIVTLNNGILTFNQEMPLFDQNGQDIGKMIMIIEHVKYDDPVPANNWPTKPCPMFEM